MKTKKFVLTEQDMPRKWYNIMADLPNGMEPPLHPGTGQPAGPEDLAPIFPMNLIEQEMSTDRWIDIPEEVLDKYAIWRPSPLFRARNLEKALGTPAKIYFKNEGVSPAGSHKPNTAIAQAYYNKVAGTKKITTETGAGQWGSALAMCCSFFGIECKVFMVKISYNHKPYRRMMMETWGARCTASPSTETEAGRRFLEQFPDTPGSLGMAISEAVEAAVSDKSGDTKYSLGSVLNHVLLHQTIIGLEAKKQLALAGVKKPDIVIGCAGGGSNFAGLSFPFVNDKTKREKIEEFDGTFYCLVKEDMSDDSIYLSLDIERISDKSFKIIPYIINNTKYKEKRSQLGEDNKSDGFVFTSSDSIEKVADEIYNSLTEYIDL